MTLKEKSKDSVRRFSEKLISELKSDYMNGRHLYKGYDPKYVLNRIHNNFYLMESTFIKHRFPVPFIPNKDGNIPISVELGDFKKEITLTIKKWEMEYKIENRNKRLEKLLD